MPTSKWARPDFHEHSTQQCSQAKCQLCSESKGNPLEFLPGRANQCFSGPLYRTSSRATSHASCIRLGTRSWKLKSGLSPVAHLGMCQMVCCSLGTFQGVLARTLISARRWYMDLPAKFWRKIACQECAPGISRILMPKGNYDSGKHFYCWPLHLCLGIMIRKRSTLSEPNCPAK